MFDFISRATDFLGRGATSNGFDDLTELPPVSAEEQQAAYDAQVAANGGVPPAAMEPPLGASDADSLNPCAPSEPSLNPKPEDQTNEYLKNVFCGMYDSPDN